MGAEIEQAVVDAMYLAFNDPKNPGREFTTQDILTALQRQVPLARSQREAIVRAGEVRMNPLFVTARRETLLAELSDHDAEVLVRVNSRNRNWA